MPEITMIDRGYIADVLDQILENEPALKEIGASVYRHGQYVSEVTVELGDGRYAIATPDDMDTWTTALDRLDALAPGAGAWVVTRSESFGSALVSYLSRHAEQ